MVSRLTGTGEPEVFYDNEIGDDRYDHQITAVTMKTTEIIMMTGIKRS